MPGFFADPKDQLVVAFGTAAPGDLRKYYREQVQDPAYGPLTCQVGLPSEGPGRLKNRGTEESVRTLRVRTKPLK